MNTNTVVFAITLIITVLVIGNLIGSTLKSAEKVFAQRAQLITQNSN